MTKNKAMKQPVKQRITVWIDPELACDAKVFALRNKIGLAQLVAQSLKQVLKTSVSTDS